jgi:hypothetical protein
MKSEPDKYLELEKKIPEILSLDDPSLADELERRFKDREGSKSWADVRDEK